MTTRCYICKQETTHKIAHPYCIVKAENAIDKQYNKLLKKLEEINSLKEEFEIGYRDLYRMEVDNQ